MAFLLNLFGMGDSKNAHQQLYGGRDDYEDDNGGNRGDRQERPHQSSWTHELIGGAAGFAAMKAYEDHARRTGEQVSHPMMKEMLAGFAAAEVDKLFETKGLDYLDREKAKQRAVHQAHHLAEEQYGPGGTFNPQGDQYGRGDNNYQQQQRGDGDRFGNRAYQQQGQGSYGDDQYGGRDYQQQRQPGDYSEEKGEHHRHHRREED